MMADTQLPPDEVPIAEVAQWVVEHQEAVYRYAYRLAGSAADAEDLTQQAFLIALRRRETLRGVANRRAWLLAVARNCFLKALRSRGSQVLTNADTEVAALADDAPDEPVVDEAVLAQALADLPAEFRVVVLMFYMEGCSYREIAEQLAIPPGTVMSRLSRAKGYLRSRLATRESV